VFPLLKFNYNFFFTKSYGLNLSVDFTLDKVDTISYYPEDLKEGIDVKLNIKNVLRFRG
jgi:hypothetical protein